MEDYKIRMIKEYTELSERYDRLTDMLFDYRHDNLQFTPACSYELLAAQQMIMLAYINILKERARIENINLGDNHE